MIAFLKKKGYFVRCVDVKVKERVKQRGEMFNQADEVWELDLRLQKNVDKAVEGMDWVFHFAGDMGGVGYFHIRNFTPVINNMQMDLNMLRACEEKKIKRFFFSSSACIYPTTLQMTEGKAIRLSEDMMYPSFPDQNYGWEKLLTLRLCNEAPFDARVGIFNTIYGPYQEIEGERMKFPTSITTKVIESKKTGKPIEIWGNGKQIRSFLYIDDLCERVYKVMTMPYKGPVNISAFESITVEETAKMVCEIAGIKPKFKFNKAKPSGVISRAIDNKKFNKLYKYKDKVDLKTGFSRLYAWIEAENQ
jgi:nucleoside-diphosphate-sugar epimerase